ncbi:MAG: hypothetical protein QOG85_1785 [Gaiellaceae bacterium]|nr:hypothetical protein [Gaiellaceae bacterium]
MWAGVVIVTRFDIGFLAWFVGVAASLAMIRVAGGSAFRALGVVAGLLAAAGILVGKYVVFVHDVREVEGSFLTKHGVPTGYLDTFQMSYFIHHYSTIVRPIYYLWLLLAVVAAVRTAEKTHTAAYELGASLPDSGPTEVRQGMRQCTKEGCDLRYVPVGPTTVETCESCGSPTQQTSVSVVS